MLPLIFLLSTSSTLVFLRVFMRPASRSTYSHLLHLLQLPSISQYSTDPQKKIYGPEYLCENSKDKMRNYSNPDPVKIGRDANKMGRKIHRILHTHFCPCPYLTQHGATRRKAPISGFFLETETKEWTERPMFWLSGVCPRDWFLSHLT